jgi:hypothetical protein
MVKFKPIAMRCTQEQFDAIKLKLGDIKIYNTNNFKDYPYLTNNYGGETKYIFNVKHSGRHDYNRTAFEEWDEDIFLEYCGVEVNKKKFVKCIDTGGNYHLTEGKEYEVIGEFINNFTSNYNIRNDIGIISGYFKHRFEIVNQEENKNMSQKLKISVTDVLRIHQIACSTWQELIAGYLSRTDNKQMIKFTQEEVDRMFKAATTEQKPVLEEIFGKQSKPIDWDKIKTGSRVMIKHNSQHVEGLNAINLSKPVDVVFFKTPHLIDFGGKFKSAGEHSYYCTFHQNGNYAMFAAEQTIDYITEVIEY